MQKSRRMDTQHNQSQGMPGQQVCCGLDFDDLAGLDLVAFVAEASCRRHREGHCWGRRPLCSAPGWRIGAKRPMMVKEKKDWKKDWFEEKTVHAKRLEYEFVAIKVLMGLGSGSKFLVDSCLVGPGGGKNSTQEMMILDVVGLGGGKKIHPRLEIKKKKSKALGSTNLTRSTFKKKAPS